MSTEYKDTTALIRRGNKDDMKSVLEMIQELPNLEKLSDAPQVTLKDLQHDGFDLQPPAFHCFVAEVPDQSQYNIVGYALFYPLYSTWSGRCLMLFDLYVKSFKHSNIVENKLFAAVAKEAYSTGCQLLYFLFPNVKVATEHCRIEGAADIKEDEVWCHYKLSGDALQKAARESN